MRTRSPLQSCPSCEGFLPASASACPHCGARASAVGTWARRAAVVVAGAGFGVTLMACYGPPPRGLDRTPLIPSAEPDDASAPTPPVNDGR